VLNKNPLPLIVEKKQKKMHRNTKYWSMTWDTNVKQKSIPKTEKLKRFFDQTCTEATWQYEIGSIKQKEHVQGVFTLEGPRQSNVATLKVFSDYFGNISGLTLKPVYDRVAINAYVSKEEGRVSGPYYAGKNVSFDINMAETPLRTWQKKLFDLLTSDKLPMLKNRKVIWVEDKQGNTGKSWFRKWLETGQNQLTVRSLPVSNVDRLMSAVHIINKTTKVDVYTINLTKTRGEGESFKDLFSAVEQIKDGHVVDVMYGKYNRSFFDPPVIIIFTNEDLLPHIDCLKRDRWYRIQIIKDEIIETNAVGVPEVEISLVKQAIKNVEDRAAGNSSSMENNQ